ncbi:outer membrane beta-barrel family protein [Dinghuibacter silviterrae]|uniref:Outer membrane receptor protein involved in Fe transport n=1 Tax=Dinghuibacter silviterrae TaxID=1539049 RepID=A0A4R8DWQ9_9BACT|nr:outer membrane beta-barrel family protein [Dinghuibacter silviterrae]TDX01651.1 outer membrane receptor protein involved in Fe transport [Dinghuibacter silviterrae]
MRKSFFAGLLCLPVPLLAQKTRVDTLREVRILGQRPLLEKKLDRTIVHVDALLANTGGQAWQVLENTPGVLVDEDGTITLNGKSGVLVMIDDRPTYLEGTDLVNYLKSLPASTLAQIELLPNPPARYPASGSGIIILRTKRAERNGFHAQLTSNYTQSLFPHVSQSIDVNGQEGPWQITARAGYVYNRNYFVSDRYRRLFDSGDTDNQDIVEDSWAQNISYGASVEHKGRHTSWGALCNGEVGPYHELGHYQDGFLDATGKTDSLTDIRSHYHNQSADVSANAHVRHDWTHEGRSLSADADFVYDHSTAFQDEVSTTTLPGGQVSDIYELIDQQPFTAAIYGLKADYTDKFGQHLYLEAGAQETYSIRQNQGIYTDGTPPALTPDTALNNTFRYDEQIRSAYVTLRRETKGLALQAGLRMENTWGKGKSPDSSFRLDYVNLFPSVHALIGGVLSLAYSRRIDRPGYGDLNPSRFYFDRNSYFSGNTALQPAFSQNLEAAYTYRSRYTLTAGYSTNRGEIHQVFIAEGNTFYYYAINMDRAVVTRLALDVATPLTAHWTVNLHTEGGIHHYRSALPDSTLLNKSLGFVQVSGNTRYSWGKGWSAEASGFYLSNLLVAQWVIRPYGHLDLALRKKCWGDKGAVTLQGIDVLHTWINARTIYLSNAVAHFRNDFHHPAVSLTFSYSLGRKEIKTTEHKTGVEEEKARL